MRNYAQMKRGIDMRVGIGYDVHKFEEGRKLILGGVDIPFEKGLLGHSDADVLVHAVMDAILGAAGMGDIGHLFPDTDPEFEGISSIELLKSVRKLMAANNYSVENIDAIIVAEQPKIAPYREEMITNIADALNIGEDRVNIKATTEEGLGFTGKGLGIASQAVALIDDSLSI